MEKTLILRRIGPETCVVDNTINLEPGTPYPLPADWALLRVPQTAYVGPGFVGTLGGDGVWTFEPPPADEPAPAVSVQEQIAALEQAISDLKAAIG